jgi:CRP-like cAMP-binding protein
MPWGLTRPVPVAPLGSDGLINGVASSRITDPIHSFSLFADLSASEIREIIAPARERIFLRRETIFSQGDPLRQVFLLTSGCLKITQLGQNGAEVILRLNGPGEVFGASGWSTRGVHGSSARTLQSSTALVWDAGVFEALAENFPLLRRNVARILHQRLQELEERFREISTEKVASRLGHEIARLLQQIGQHINGAVQLNLSREELAQWTGTTMFTVCRLLSKWEREGIVSTGREAGQVHNLQALVELAESA